MLLELTSDQEVFRDTTAKFLADQVPVDALRRLRHDPVGYEQSFWQRGAELGWTAMLVSEEHGGGTISDRGLVDLALVAYEFGYSASPGPLVSSNVVAAALSAANDGRFDDVLGAILEGGSVASWAVIETPPANPLAGYGFDIAVDGDHVVLNGVKRPIESGAQADHLLVSGRTGDGLTQVLVASDAPGLTIEPMKSVDLTRRFAKATFDNVRVPLDSVVGAVGQAAAEVQWQLDVAATLTVAESVGAMQRGFDLTKEWMFERYSFGRPLASYQALKHRFADMFSWLEGSHAIADAAAVALASGSDTAAQLVSAAKAYVGDAGCELLQECVQLHGGIGVTFEHDLHLYLRRVTLDRTLYGTPQEHRQRLATLVAESKESA